MKRVIIRHVCIFKKIQKNEKNRLKTLKKEFNKTKKKK